MSGYFGANKNRLSSTSMRYSWNLNSTFFIYISISTSYPCNGQKVKRSYFEHDNRSNKSDKSDESDQNYESDGSDGSDKSDEIDGSDKSDKSDESDQNDKSDESDAEMQKAADTIQLFLLMFCR